MSKAWLAVALSAALSAPACTVVLPITLASRAADHNRRADAEAARSGRPADRQSVGARGAAGFVGGLAIDTLLFYVAAFAVFSTTSTH